MKSNPFKIQTRLIGRQLERWFDRSTARSAPGSAPGIEYFPEVDRVPERGAVTIRYTCFNKQQLENHVFDSCDAFLEFTLPTWAENHWIDVVGIHPFAIRALAERFGIHSLAAENIVHIPQRAKVESYDQGLFIIEPMLTLDSATGKIAEEQVSFWMHKNFLFTFQEHSGDVWNSVRQRLEVVNGRMRNLGTPYLLYALIDALVDQLFPVLESFESPLQQLEETILKNPSSNAQETIYAFRRELAYLKRMIWPLRETIDDLYRNEDLEIPDEIQAYFRSIYDHTLEANERVDSFRDFTGSLNEFCVSSISARMNEIMKVLTIMASLFIPITFIAGVYGMNFETLPELQWKYAYPTFWAICLSIIGGLLIFFRKRKWL